MAYATPAQLMERYDARTIGDLASDLNTQVAAGSLPVNANVLAALNDASGDIDSALLTGGMYTPAVLTALSGNSQYKLIRLTCQFAMLYLYERRPMVDPKAAEAFRKLYNDALDRLRKGENVFDVPANLAAGNPTIDGPTTVEYQGLNLLVDRTHRYYPGRALPHNR